MEENKLSREQTDAILAPKLQNIIEGPGKYEMRVTSVTPYEKELGNGRKQVAIVNVAAMTVYQYKMSQNFYQQGQFDKSANENISFSVRDVDYLPAKGEILEVTMTNFFSTKVNKTILVVGSYKEQPVKKATAMTMAQFLNGGHATEERVELITQTEEEIPEFVAGKSQTA